MDQEVEGSSLTEQPQLEQLDGQQSEPKQKESQLWQVNLEALVEEQEQLPTIR